MEVPGSQTIAIIVPCAAAPGHTGRGVAARPTATGGYYLYQIGYLGFRLARSVN